MDGNRLSYALIRDNVGGAEVLHAFGELDLSNAAELESALNEMAESADPLVLDLSACRYLDSTVISVLVRSVKRWDGNFAIVVPENNSTRRVFRIVGLEDILPIEPDLASAGRRLKFSITEAS
jgi:anti-anti-sigma factor